MSLSNYESSCRHFAINTGSQQHSLVLLLRLLCLLLRCMQAWTNISVEPYGNEFSRSFPTENSTVWRMKYSVLDYLVSDPQIVTFLFSSLLLNRPIESFPHTLSPPTFLFSMLMGCLLLVWYSFTDKPVVAQFSVITLSRAVFATDLFILADVRTRHFLSRFPCMFSMVSRLTEH